MKTEIAKNLKKKDAIRAWLDGIALANRQRKCLPADVVEAARDPDTPAHSKFDWNDTRAAHKWRLQQAEELIREVYTVEAGERVPYFVSLLPDRQQPGGGYRRLTDVLSSKALREQLLLTAQSELRSWSTRHEILSKLARAGLLKKTAREILRPRRRHSETLRRKKPR